MTSRVRAKVGQAWFRLAWRLRPAVGRPRIRLRTLLRLLYPNPLPEDLDHEQAAYRVAGSNTVRRLATVRDILATLDAHSAPSPVSVRFGPEDVVEADVGGVRLALDRADHSVASVMLRDGAYEPHVTRVLTGLLAPGMTFLDVGANVGYFTVLAGGLVGAGGRVIAVEPSSENCRLLLRSLELNHLANVTLLPLALAEETGWSYLVHHVGSNSSLGAAGDVVGGWGQVVPTVRGDAVVTGPVDVVKMDVEGAEGLVVAGLAPVIERCRPVVVSEASEEMLGRVSGRTLAQYVGWFVDRDYRCAVIPEDGSPPRDIEAVDAFVARWGDRFRIENLLFRPR
jgi:FkbM family methyltransferase